MEYRINKIILFLVLPNILYSTFHIPPALAAGIEVSPANFDIKLESGKSFTGQLTVANPTADVQIFEISADEFAEIFEFKPASFTLESGERKTVHIGVSAPNSRLSESRLFSTNISVLASPLADSRFQANTGVKIPINITTAEQTQNEIPYPVIAGALAGIAAVIYISFFRHKHPH